MWKKMRRNSYQIRSFHCRHQHPYCINSSVAWYAPIHANAVKLAGLSFQIAIRYVEFVINLILLVDFISLALSLPPKTAKSSKRTEIYSMQRLPRCYAMALQPHSRWALAVDSLWIFGVTKRKSRLHWMQKRWLRWLRPEICSKQRKSTRIVRWRLPCRAKSKAIGNCIKNMVQCHGSRWSSHRSKSVKMVSNCRSTWAISLQHESSKIHR